MRDLAIKGFVAIALIGACAPYAAAQEMTVDRPDEQASPKETDRRKKPDTGTAPGDIVVTGSLIRGLPKEYVASPVFTYGQADIVHSGAGSVS